MSFDESVLFAAIMTLMDEQESKKALENIDQIDGASFANDVPFKTTYDVARAKQRLCQIAQDLFDRADEECQTTSDVSAKEMIPFLINGLIFETANAIDDSEERKKEVYEFSAQYCALDDAFPWDYFCVGNGEMADSLLAITSTSMDMLLTASSRGKKEDALSGLIRLLVELMIYMERAINETFVGVVLHKRPPIIVLDKALASCKMEMKRMENENSTHTEQLVSSEERANLDMLLKNAKTALNSESMNRAAACFRDVLEIAPNTWEAIFYSVFCSAYRTKYTAKANEIPELTATIIRCVPSAMRHAKDQLYSRLDIVTELGDVVTRTCDLASNYFIAAMNAFKASNGNLSDNKDKICRVSAIIDMVFAVGDGIEKYFGDDFEVGKNIACICWKIGFDCFESCNMPAPEKMYDYYKKIKKYEPSFTCVKPIIGNEVEKRSEGCYIATAVYGSYDCPQVWTLRRYRDFSLSHKWFGRLFIRIYYAISPTFVRVFKNTKWFNAIFRSLLDSVTKQLKVKGFEDTPYVDNSATDPQ